MRLGVGSYAIGARWTRSAVATSFLVSMFWGSAAGADVLRMLVSFDTVPPIPVATLSLNIDFDTAEYKPIGPGTQVTVIPETLLQGWISLANEPNPGGRVYFSTVDGTGTGVINQAGALFSVEFDILGLDQGPRPVLSMISMSDNNVQPIPPGMQPVVVSSFTVPEPGALASLLGVAAALGALGSRQRRARRRCAA